MIMNKLYCNKLNKYITLKDCDVCKIKGDATIVECRRINLAIK